MYLVPAVLIPVLRLYVSFSSYSPAYQSLNELAYLAFEEGNGDLSPLAINIGSWEKGQDEGVPGRMERGRGTKTDRIQPIIIGASRLHLALARSASES